MINENNQAFALCFVAALAGWFLSGRYARKARNIARKYRGY